jgi:GDPmannose 4,6-dehydratase
MSTSKPVALVTGITGQDGAYLAKLLLDNGYEVHGAYRRTASMNLWRLQELGIERQVKMVAMDLLEYSNIQRVLETVRPDEVYNLAAQSFVGISFEQPLYTSDVDALGVTRILEAIRSAKPDTRFYQASTSEMYGKVQQVPQTEKTSFYPRSPYGVAKVYGHWMTVNYRESYNLHATSGILFNHESPLRGQDFVTRKITMSLARIREGLQDVLELGNLDSERDWGFAGDYVRGMWQMVQQPEPDDYVLATGHTRSVREFVDLAAVAAGFDIAWEGEGANSIARSRSNGKVIIRVNPEFYRPAEVDQLVGDAAKARERLGWKPEVTFEQLVEQMAKADLDRASRGMLYL